MQELLPYAFCALGLRRFPVGVTLHHDLEAYRACDVRPLKTAMSYCAMVRLACLGRARKSDAATMRCPGARRALGFVPPDEEFTSGARYLSLGMYPDLERARKTAERVAILPGPLAGIAVQPLDRCASPPQAVIVICSSNQAMRLIQGYVHQFGPPAPQNALGMQGLCAELTAHPLLSHSLNVSPLCSNTRFTCAWEDGEAGVAMPFSAFAGTLRGVLDTLNAAESDRTKRAIRARAAAAGIDLGVAPGTAYYAATPVGDALTGRAGREPTEARRKERP